MRNIALVVSLLFLACQQNVATDDTSSDIPVTSKGDSYYESISSEGTVDNMTGRLPSEMLSDAIIIDEIVITTEQYPPGPHALELFKVLPNMKFYDPWRQDWFSLSQLYQHEEHKAFILVSSAGWCGPCLKEASALIDVYEKYHVDGLEIIYTLGNTSIPGDAPFDTTYEDPSSAEFAADLEFMETWGLMTQQDANAKLNYHMYADPNREFLKYFPNHAWPLSLLVTTNDMGIRLIEEGYWSALMENKIMLVLYNDVPKIPFE